MGMYFMRRKGWLMEARRGDNMRTKVRISYPHTLTGPAGDINGLFRIDQSGTAELLPGEFLDREEATNLCKRAGFAGDDNRPAAAPAGAPGKKGVARLANWSCGCAVAMRL